MEFKGLLLATVIVAATAACSDDSARSPTNNAATTSPAGVSTTTATTLTTTTPAGPAGVDAAGHVEFRQTVVGFVVNTVIAYGEQGLDPEVIAQAVIATYPSLQVRGSAVEADETGISIWSNTANDKEVASADNPWVFAVAVMDTSGTCLGGAAYGFPVADTTITVDDPAACTGQAVAEAAIASL